MAEGTSNTVVVEVTDEGRLVERITPQGLPSIYANNVALRTSAWDIALDFGVILEATEERLRFQDVVQVIMSPQHARVLSEVLADSIRLYEEKFGPIPRPPEGSEKEAGK